MKYLFKHVKERTRRELSIHSLFSLCMVVVVLAVIAILILFLSGDLSAMKECKQNNPDADFCNNGSAGVKCGETCQSIDMEILHFDNGGIFSTDSCSCINKEAKEIINVY